MVQNDNSKLVAILSYFLVGIIWYFADEKMKKNELAKFHTKQALFLILGAVAVGILGMMLVSIPLIGWFLTIILQVALLILWILGLIKAAEGKREPIPLVGQYANELFKF
ncbi:MAG: DUF4870 domain-containing protein [Candidatus Woesearchaeota archaeon]